MLLLLNVVVSIIYLVYGKNNVNEKLLILLSYSIPVYSYDIMGYAYSSSHLFSLFIVYTIILFLNLLRKGNWHVLKEYRRYFIFGTVISSLFCLHAIFIHHEGTLSELLNFLMLFAFMLIFLINSEENCNIKTNVVLDEYSKMCVNISLLIIIQAFIQVKFNYNIITMAQSLDRAQIRLRSELLYDDISSATIGLGIGAFWYFFYSKNKFKYILGIVTLLGMIASSARTGFVSFGFVVALKLLYTYKRELKKLFLIAIIGVFLVFATTLLLALVRPEVKTTGLLANNSRFMLIEVYVKALKDHVLLGYGLGSIYLQGLFNLPMPHFSLLNIADQVGVPITIILVLFVVSFIYNFCRNKLNFELVLFILVGSCFIPEIWSTKFICLIFAIVLIKTVKKHNTRKI